MPNSRRPQRSSMRHTTPLLCEGAASLSELLASCVVDRPRAAVAGPVPGLEWMMAAPSSAAVAPGPVARPVVYPAPGAAMGLGHS